MADGLHLIDLETRESFALDPAVLTGFSERHHLPDPTLQADSTAPDEVVHSAKGGVVIRLHSGLPSEAEFEASRNIRGAGRPLYYYWPHEQAVEVIDDERLGSVGRHLAFVDLYWRWREFRRGRADMQRTRLLRRQQAETRRAAEAEARAREAEARMTRTSPAPVAKPDAPKRALSDAIQLENGQRRTGRGLYVRLDYWAKLKGGGSYGHTCYQVKALKAASTDVIAILASRFDLLDEFGVPQVVLPSKKPNSDEYTLVENGEAYEPVLQALFELYQPAYVFERTVLGNCSVAKICKRLGIPYIAEYNGSELTMSKVFGGREMANSERLLECEQISFDNADIISVISEPVKDELVERGIPADKILINPNGVDLSVYHPPEPGERRALRASLGFGDDDVVLGFCATFGGWHGVEVLAEALPAICEARPNTKFLLIGGGNFKHLVTEQIAAHGLEGRVHDAGMVPQMEAARLLGACDIFLSPHSKTMGDKPFFGSPTKLFEYMGYGIGIVCSDLAQLGEVMRPAITADEARAGARDPRARSILVRPGSVEDLVDASLILIDNPEYSALLGRNALQAAKDFYSWDVHVDNLLRFARGEPLEGYNRDRSIR